MISIIVPIYNVEYYIHRCIDSILTQDNVDFELLLIDDGSSDRSGEICDEYAKQDSRVRVYHKQNGGVSSARNLGLDKAQGEWITFIDADDWIEPGYLRTFVSLLDADMVICGVNSTDGKCWIMGDGICSIKDLMEIYIAATIMRSPWGKFLRKDIINKNDIRFDPKIRYGEDFIFNMQYLLFSNSVRTLSYVGYNYYQYPQEELPIKKYKLTIEETKYSLEKSLLVKEQLINKLGIQLSYDIDYMVYLGLWPINNMVDEAYLDEYYQLCKSLDLTLDKESFYNHKLFSPIIRGITELKIFCEEKRIKEMLMWCKALYLINSRIGYSLRFPYKDFYLWLWLIKHQAYRILLIMLRIYISIKCLVKK